MIPVWNRILKRSDAKKNSVDNVSSNSGHSTYTSQLRPSNEDDSTISSQTSVTSDAKSSFTHQNAEDSVHSNTIFADEHSIIGSNMYLFRNVDQVLVAPEYKGELHDQPIIAELTQYEWELVIREQMKQHISNNINEISMNAQFRSGNRDLIIRDNPAWDLGIFLH